jgi:hypothetical protein
VGGYWDCGHVMEWYLSTGGFRVVMGLLWSNGEGLRLRFLRGYFQCEELVLDKYGMV